MKVTSDKTGIKPVVFDLDPGAKLILEKGTIIEFHYSAGQGNNISLFSINGDQFALHQSEYPQLEYTHDEVNNVKRIVVHEDTVITG